MFRISCVFILIFSLARAQERSIPEIDSALLHQNYNFLKEGKYKESIAFNFELIEKSRQKKYTKGIGWGYLNIGNVLSILSQYEESLKYLGLAEKELNKTEDFHLKAKISANIGKVNHFLGLYEVALNYYNKAIIESEKIRNIKVKKSILNYTYACKADNFEALNQYDSLRIYFQKAYNLHPNPITAANIASYFITHKKDEIDSAKYYLDAGNDLIKTNAFDTYQNLIVLKKYGNFYVEKKEYAKALNYYLQSLAIADKIKKKDERKYLFKLISNTYKSLNNEEKAKEFFLKYAVLNDSLNAQKNAALNISVHNLVTQKEKEKKNLKNNSYFIVILISAVGIGILIAGFLLYIKNKKAKELLIQHQKDEITQTKTEKRNLEHKVNDAFREVLELAKKNDPSFLARFKEVYPEFCERFLNLYPNIVASEFIFCAYLKLNFSTKEIARYTFVTERAIQVRKSRLRKKINIPSDEDLYIWINRI